MRKVFTSYYAAKFAREDQERPTDWVIRCERGQYELVYIGGHLVYHIEAPLKAQREAFLAELRERDYGMMP